MGRPARLTKAYVDLIDAPGRFSDGRGGNGLSLRVRRSRDGVGLTRAWEQRVHAGGQTLTLGLGGYPAVGISEARRLAVENVQKIKARHPRVSALDRLLAADVEAPGLGPDATAPVTIQQASPAPLFREVAEQYIEGQRPSWKQGSKTEKQTRSLLDRYVLLKVGGPTRRPSDFGPSSRSAIPNLAHSRRVSQEGETTPSGHNEACGSQGTH